MSGEGDWRRASDGGSRRCAWATKMQTELANRGTLVGLIDGIWSDYLSGGEGFTWNVGRNWACMMVGAALENYLRKNIFKNIFFTLQCCRYGELCEYSS